MQYSALNFQSDVVPSCQSLASGPSRYHHDFAYSENRSALYQEHTMQVEATSKLNPSVRGPILAMLCHHKFQSKRIP